MNVERSLKGEKQKRKVWLKFVCHGSSYKRSRYLFEKALVFFFFCSFRSPLTLPFLLIKCILPLCWSADPKWWSPYGLSARPMLSFWFCFHLTLILLDDEFGWVWVEFSLFLIAADTSLGTDVFFHSYRAVHHLHPQTTILCWFFPTPSALISHYMCATFYNTTFLIFFFFLICCWRNPQFFNPFNFFICCFSVSISSSVWCVVVAL